MASATVATRIEARREPLFAYFIPIDLPEILAGYGPVPAVERTSSQTGPWDVPGSSRDVHLADGSTAHEEVTDCQPPSYFAYRVSEFTNPVRLLATHAIGQWHFADADADAEAGATDVSWTYTFVPRSGIADLLLRPVLRFAWRGYMQRAIERFRTLAEQHAPRAA